MNTEQLKTQNKEYSKKISQLKKEILCLEATIKKNSQKIQSECQHEWEIETQMYERTVLCKHCDLINWDRSTT